jgi:hydroxylamine reductase
MCGLTCVSGVCGKTPNTAALQDLLMELSKGISGYARKARDLGAAYTDREVDRFVMESLFSSMTNVNFDSARFVQYCRQAVAMRDRAYNLYLRAANETKVPEAKRLPSPSKAPATSALGLQLAADEAGMIKQAENVGVLAHKAQFGVRLPSPFLSALLSTSILSLGCN